MGIPVEFGLVSLRLRNIGHLLLFLLDLLDQVLLNNRTPC